MTHPDGQSLSDLETGDARRGRAREGATVNRRSSLAASLTASVVLVVLVAGGAALWNGTHRQPPAAATVLGGVTLDSAHAAVTVVMDGWSVQNLNGVLSYTADDGVLTTVRLTPASAADVAELAKTTPKILTQVAARTITDDITLSCSAAGCKTATTT